MTMMLTAAVFLPLLGAVVAALLPTRAAGGAKWIALVVTGVDFALVAWLTATFDRSHAAAFQFVEKASWLPQAGIQYYLGADGVSITMLLLSALLTLISVLVSWKTIDKPGAWFAMLMLLEVGMNGVFVALDFVLFYMFWELVLIPMYFMIAKWGGARRQYASLKFFVYTLAGSVLMLVAILALYLHPSGGTFDMVELIGRGFPLGFQMWVFAAFFVAFAIKVPIFPFHTWLPDAHVEAPTAGSVLLAGVLLKMGAYGFIRVSMPILPEAFVKFVPAIIVLAVISIIYGAAVALVQPDLKKLVAYSSVSHMGFVMLGLASMNVEGVNGAVAVMFSHGLLTGMLFMLVGMVYERTHTRMIADMQGLSAQAPLAGGLLAFASFGSLGLPFMSGFVGEFLALLGAWKSTMWTGWVVLAGIGVLLAAAYMLWMVKRVVYGEPGGAVVGITDLSTREVMALAPLVVLTIVVGVWWTSILGYIDPVASALLKLIPGAA